MVIGKETKKKMAMKKRGSSSPKFGGWFITPNGVYGSSKQAAKANDTYDNKILRYCRKGESGYGFKAEPGKEPEWYLKILAESKSLVDSIILSGKVTRGKRKNYYLTPEGMFGCVKTACEHNDVSEEELKKLCLMGKKGYKTI